ncbi:MAG: hypothetical protein ABI363_04765 [Nitrosospira sp.]
MRQHLASLEAAGTGVGGRYASAQGEGVHNKLYILTEQGKEMSPRQYSWLAQLVVASVQREEGAKNMGKRLSEIGASVAQQIRSEYPGLTMHQEKVEKLVENGSARLQCPQCEAAGVGIGNRSRKPRVSHHGKERSGDLPPDRG